MSNHKNGSIGNELHQCIGSQRLKIVLKMTDWANISEIGGTDDDKSLTISKQTYTQTLWIMDTSQRSTVHHMSRGSHLLNKTYASRFTWTPINVLIYGCLVWDAGPQPNDSLLLSTF